MLVSIKLFASIPQLNHLERTLSERNSKDGKF